MILFEKCRQQARESRTDLRSMVWVETRPTQTHGQQTEGAPHGRGAAPSLSHVTVHLARMARRVAFAALATAFFARMARRVAFAALATAFFARMAFIAARIAFAMV